MKYKERVLGGGRANREGEKQGVNDPNFPPQFHKLFKQKRLIATAFGELGEKRQLFFSDPIKNLMCKICVDWV